MSHYLILILLLFAYMNVWFIVSVLKKRNDVADEAWGLGFVFVAWTALFVFDVFTLRGVLVDILVSIWGLRLSWHIYKRHRGKGEDYRYLAWRTEWGRWFYLRSYLQIYLLQGFLLFLIVLPVIHSNASVFTGLYPFDLLGIAVWLIGFCFEAVGDAQLARFITNPENKGKLMQEGLWAYSRHPNYFGEVTQWWGLWIIAISAHGGIFTVIGPLTITFLILKVSGVPLLEKKMEENPQFEEYKRKTSMFFPLPPRTTSHASHS
jgi:steroid 5-alpha reductase family enzyme